MIEDPDMYDLSHAEFKAWIYCLSRASQKATSEVEISYRHALRICNIEQVDFENMFKKMEKNISVRHAYAHVRPPVHDKQTNKQDKHNKQTIGDGEKKFELEFEIPEPIMATYQSVMGYPEDIITQTAKEAYGIYVADSSPNKNWNRFLSHYIKNQKPKIDEELRQRIEKDAMRKKYEGSEYEF